MPGVRALHRIGLAGNVSCGAHRHLLFGRLLPIKSPWSARRLECISRIRVHFNHQHQHTHQLYERAHVPRALQLHGSKSDHFRPWARLQRASSPVPLLFFCVGLAQACALAPALSRCQHNIECLGAAPVVHEPRVSKKSRRGRPHLELQPSRSLSALSVSKRL